MIIFYLLQRFHTILCITLCHLHTVVFYVLLVWFYEMLCQKWRNKIKLWNQSVNNGLAPNKRQAIPGTNVDQDLLHHKVQLSHNEITLNGLVGHFRLDDDLKFF